MDALFTIVKALSTTRYEHDFVDRLSFQVTSLIFVLATALISYKSYFGQAIICWTPMQFRGGWDEYTNDYCFIESTYYIPLANRSLPTDFNKRDDTKLSYYQWVPFVLALQAATFSLPYLFWRTFNWMSGIQVRAIINMATSAGNNSSSKMNHEELNLVCNHMINGLKMSREKQLHNINSNLFGLLLKIFWLKTRCYVSICYLITKCLYVLNIIAQIAIINFFLDIPTENLMWGINLLVRLFRGNDWSDTGIFPRVTMCDFEIRELGNLHRWTIQCVLPLNMFNEKIYVFLWFWLHILLIIFIVNGIIWAYNIIIMENRYDFINSCIKTAKVLDNHIMKEQTHAEVMDNMLKTLGWDGILILRLISSNAGELTSVCLVQHIYAKIAAETPML